MSHWHNGSAGTYFAVMEVYPKSGLVIVVVTNVGLEGQAIGDKIISAIRAKEIAR